MPSNSFWFALSLNEPLTKEQHKSPRESRGGAIKLRGKTWVGGGVVAKFRSAVNAVMQD